MENYHKDVVIAKFMEAKRVHEKTMNPNILKWESKKLPLLDGRFVSGHELKFEKDLYWILPIVKVLELNISITTPINVIRDMCYDEIEKRKESV